jgi:hypothetical protein
MCVNKQLMLRVLSVAADGTLLRECLEDPTLQKYQVGDITSWLAMQGVCTCGSSRPDSNAAAMELILQQTCQNW